MRREEQESLRSEPILFQRFPRLRGRVPWTPLGTFPTPVSRLEKVGARLGRENLFVKRDNLSGKIYGGNKVRKLEFTLADALARKRNPVITLGAAGSNHVLATALYCRQLGLESVGILIPQPVQESVRKNLLCDAAAGCEIIYAQSLGSTTAKAASVYLGRWWQKRRRPYLLWVGGSTPLGVLGYVEAALEIASQVEAGEMPAPEFIFVPVGSAGTFAGLLLGLKLTALESMAVGVRVADRLFANEQMTAFLANRALAYLRRLDPSVPGVRVEPGEVYMLHDYYGAGYGQYTTKGMEALELMREEEGITLDGTYSAKTFAAFLDFMSPRARQNTPGLFINTYNSRPLDQLLAASPGPQSLPPPLQEYFHKEIAPVKR